jgi:hypothetical protein
MPSWSLGLRCRLDGLRRLCCGPLCQHERQRLLCRVCSGGGSCASCTRAPARFVCTTLQLMLALPVPRCRLVQGYMANVSEASVCSACPAGWRAASARASACSACLAGYYTSAGGSAVCIECPPVREAPRSACCVSPCECVRTFAQGYFGNASGVTNCTACRAGRSAAHAGSSVCADCDAGSYASVNGSAACELCAPVAPCSHYRSLANRC